MFRRPSEQVEIEFLGLGLVKFWDTKLQGEEIFRRASVYTDHLMNQLEEYCYLSLSGVGFFC